MNLIIANMKWIMIVFCALTCTMLFASIAPRAALQATFGDSMEGPLAEIIVRNWGALIGLVGAMLIYGAYRPSVRLLVLTIAGISKLIFVGLVVAQGSRYLGKVGPALGVDLAMVALYVGYLIGARRGLVAA